MEEITITKEQFRKAVARASAEVMAEHSAENPEAMLIFSLSSVAFAGILENKLFSAEPNVIHTDADTISDMRMRQELADFCHGRDCDACPLIGNEFKCGRGFHFQQKPDEVGYMSNDMIIQHYNKMKEYCNE